MLPTLYCNFYSVLDMKCLNTMLNVSIWIRNSYNFPNSILCHFFSNPYSFSLVNAQFLLIFVSDETQLFDHKRSSVNISWSNIHMEWPTLSDQPSVTVVLANVVGDNITSCLTQCCSYSNTVSRCLHVCYV